MDANANPCTFVQVSRLCHVITLTFLFLTRASGFPTHVLSGREMTDQSSLSTLEGRLLSLGLQDGAAFGQPMIRLEL
jgi:hypothetical protein